MHATAPKQVREHVPMSLPLDSSHSNYSFEEDMQFTDVNLGSPSVTDDLLYNWIEWDGVEFDAMYVAPYPSRDIPNHDLVIASAYSANHC